MNRDQLARYAAIAYAGLAGDEQRVATTVRPAPGIEIVLIRLPDDRITLKAIQETVTISAGDARIIADAFKVPAGTEPEHTVRRSVQRVSQRQIWEHVVSWTWRELPSNH